MLIGVRDKGILDRNDCQNQTLSKGMKTAPILGGELQER